MDNGKETALDVIIEECKDADMTALIRIVPDIYELINDQVALAQAKSALLIRADEIGDKKLIQSIMTSVEKQRKSAERQRAITFNRDTSAAFLDLDKNGLPCDTITNFKQIMLCDSRYKNIRFNLITNQAEVIRLDLDGTEKLENWTDTDDAASQDYIESEYKLYSPQKHQAALRMLFRLREYNPILNLIDGLQWDGENRIEHFLTKWLKAEDSAYTREVSRLIFAGGINRLYNPGCKFDDVPVFVGTKQGEGKSTLIKWLAINEEWFSEIKKIEGPDSVEALFGAWICEIPELSAFKKADDVESIKAYITRQKDKYRKPYDRTPIEYPRRCIFLATTNVDRFLTDKTGNRRFYPVTARSSGYDLFEHEKECKEYILQCWAEARERFKAGNMPPFANRDLVEEYQKHQEDAMEDDWRVGAIAAYLERFPPGFKVCAIQIYKECINPDGGNPPKIQESRAIGQIMNKMQGWEKCSTFRTEKFGKQKGWVKVETEKAQSVNELPF